MISGGGTGTYDIVTDAWVLLWIDEDVKLTKLLLYFDPPPGPGLDAVLNVGDPPVVPAKEPPPPPPRLGLKDGLVLNDAEEKPTAPAPASQFPALPPATPLEL